MQIAAAVPAVIGFLLSLSSLGKQEVVDSTLAQVSRGIFPADTSWKTLSGLVSVKGKYLIPYPEAKFKSLKTEFELVNSILF